MSHYDIDAPQLGEHAWHAFTADPEITTASVAHRDRIESVVGQHLPDLDWRRARILEVGAYRHYTGHVLAAQRACEYVATDISAAALRDGRLQAVRNGVAAGATLVAGDFHDLPFSSDFFDAVFVASSVHHSRRPEIVLREMLRVMKPGGLLLLDNEPCARLCCFHAFASNRADSLTPFEARLHEAGLLPTLSSPFWGSRPEHLFGMVENDRIPLSLFMEVFAEAGSVIDRSLSPAGLIGAMETGLMGLTERGDALAAKVRGILREAVSVAASAYGPTERRLGYGLPTECDIHALAGAVTHVIEHRAAYQHEDEWSAELFGAALRAVVRKHPGAQGDVPLFKRQMTTDGDGLVRESDSSLDAKPLLPDLPTCEDGSLLEPWFPRDDWRWLRGDDGIRTMANLAATCRVAIAPQAERTLLLVRYYAVVTDGKPYRIRLWGGGVVLAEQLVVLQESRLIRAFVPLNCAQILFELVDDDEAIADFAWRLRVGVFQQFAL